MLWTDILSSGVLSRPFAFKWEWKWNNPFGWPMNHNWGPTACGSNISYTVHPFLLSKLSTYQVPEDEVKTEDATTNKINNCHIWVYAWNKVTVQSLFPEVNEMSQRVQAFSVLSRIPLDNRRGLVFGLSRCINFSDLPFKRRFSPKPLLISSKTESTRTLSNFDFQWTKILYQNNLKHIAFFLTFFKA